MASEALKDFRERLDNDLGLTSKRRVLNSLSILLLAIQFTGAEFKEANTFIFKIEFTHQNGLVLFLCIAIVTLLFRYYAYAHEFHQELFNLMAKRMLSDNKIFRFNKYEEEVLGLLGSAVNVYGGDDPGIQYLEYKKDGLFQRKLVYLKEYHDDEESVLLDEDIPLNKLTERWTLKHVIHLYFYEFKYQIEDLVKYRENLDLLGPYLLAIVALMLTSIKIEITDVVQLWMAMTTFK